MLSLYFIFKIRYEMVNLAIKKKNRKFGMYTYDMVVSFEFIRSEISCIWIELGYKVKKYLIKNTVTKKVIQFNYLSVIMLFRLYNHHL